MTSLLPRNRVPYETKLAYLRSRRWGQGMVRCGWACIVGLKDRPIVEYEWDGLYRSRSWRSCSIGADDHFVIDPAY